MKSFDTVETLRNIQSPLVTGYLKNYYAFTRRLDKEIETAPYFSFLCFSPTPTNNKAIKTIKTKGEVVVKRTHLDLSVKCGSTPTAPD